MRETSFIKQNKEKWKEFEKILEQKDKDPDKLNDLFIQITDDLSYSRTFYPFRSVRVYLNNLAQQIFYSIYKSKKNRVSRLYGFWTHELPQLIYESRPAFRLSFLLFVLSLAIGALSSAMEPDFPRIILGDDYVDMTIENIESGDPMAVYKQRGAFGMSLGITANNLFVAFLTFVLGALYAVGTAGVLVSNGIMVGAFQYFFYEKGVFLESFLTIWTHGTLEISAIIIAGAAGFTMGRGLVFPGTLTRLQSFQISARRGLKIMIGIAPVIIMAGFIEGYLTRFTETPDIIRALFILICLVFVLGYYVWYPWMLARQGFESTISDTRIPPDYNQPVRFDRIKGSGEVFSDIFLCYKKYFKPVGLVVLISAFLFCSLSFLTSPGPPSEMFVFPQGLFFALSNMSQFFVNSSVPVLPVINVLTLGLILVVVYAQLSREADTYFDRAAAPYTASFYLVSYGKMLIIAGLIQLTYHFSGWIPFILYWLFVPFLLLSGFVSFYENKNIFSAFAKTLSLISGNFWRLLGLFALLTVVGALFYSITGSTLLWFYIEFIGWNISLEASAKAELIAILMTFTAVMVLYLVIPMLAFGIGIMYFSMVEIKEAPSIKEKIKYIGLGKRIQGIEKEV